MFDAAGGEADGGDAVVELVNGELGIENAEWGDRESGGFEDECDHDYEGEGCFAGGVGAY